MDEPKKEKDNNESEIVKALVEKHKQEIEKIKEEHKQELEKQKQNYTDTIKTILASASNPLNVNPQDEPKEENEEEELMKELRAQFKLK